MKGTTRTWSPKGALDTPYKRAKQEWDDRIGDAVIQARNWRLATFAVVLLIAMPSLIGLIYVGTLPKKVPHIVEVAHTVEPSEKAGRVTPLQRPRSNTISRDLSRRPG